MRDSGVRLLGLALLAGGGCALSRSPDAAEMSGGTGGAAPFGSSGSAGTPTAGGAGGGNASPNTGGSEAGGKGGGGSGGSQVGGGGSASGGESGSGGTTEGGAAGESGAGATGGTDTTGGTGPTGGTAGDGGAAGAGDGCSPMCGPGELCQAGNCVCAEGLSPCSGVCVDLRTDPDHCGSCMRTCDDRCSAGRCYTAVTEIPEDVVSLAMNATDIYFALRESGTISRVARTGGTVQVLATSQDKPVALALDASNVYWVNSGSTYGTGSVMKTGLSGGTPVALATDEPAPWDVQVDSTHVYWSNYPPNPGILKRVPISGGAKVELASGTAVGTTTDFSIDGSHLYWANWNGPQGSVWKVPLAGGAVTNVVTVNAYTSLAEVNAGYVYFVAGSTLERVSTAGGAPSDLTEIATAHLDVDDTGVYVGGFPDGPGGSLVKVALDGSTVTRLADAVSPLLHSALGPSDVIWADGERLIKMTSKTP